MEPRAALAAVGVVVAILLGASFAVPDRFEVAGFTHADSPSGRAAATLHRALGYDPEPGMIISADRRPRAAIEALAARLRRDPAVGLVETAWSGRRLPFLLGDGQRTLILVHFRSADTDALKAPVERLRRIIRLPGTHVDIDGYAVGFLEVARIARADLIRADAIAIPALFLLLLLLFRRVAPAAVPVAIGGVAIVGTLAVLRLLAAVTDVSVFALNLGVLLGLGLATDYGLLMVSRFREDGDVRAAARTVTLSGCAVAGAFACLLVFPQPFVRSMGLGGIAVAAIATAAARLVAPPLLQLLGPRIASVSPDRRYRGKHATQSGWER